MATNEYGIRYFKAQLDDTTYILIPINLVEGYSVSGCFYSDRVYPHPITDVDYKENRTVVDSIVTEEQLKAMYNMEDVEFLKQYYLTEEKDKVIIVELLKDGKIRNGITLNSGEITFLTSSVVTANETSVGGTSIFSKLPLIESLPPIDAISKSFCAL